MEGKDGEIEQEEAEVAEGGGEKGESDSRAKTRMGHRPMATDFALRAIVVAMPR